MPTQKVALTLLALFICSGLMAQSRKIPVDGLVKDYINGSPIKKVKITAIDTYSRKIVATTLSDYRGVFLLDLPVGKSYELIAEKKLRISKSIPLSTVALKKGSRLTPIIELERKPGYIFDVTIAEPRRTAKTLVTTIDSARIEIFNNTTFKEELVLKNWPHPNFKFAFERGNHYTIMVRRPGYFNKRIEAYVDVEDCILCFDGLGTVEPGVVDVMDHGLQSGYFLANIELEPLKLNQTFALENIYYDFNKWAIRPDAARELDHLITILKDNPAVTVELGSHTDARGSDAYNLTLSEKRAQSAVDYIVASGLIAPENIYAKGYGETQLVNVCDDGRACSETRHQENRRTELKIVGINEVDPLDKKTLRQILEEEREQRQREKDMMVKGE